MEKKSILIFDAQQRSALAATRSLGKRDDAIVYTTDSSSDSLAGSSKYSKEYLQSPDPVEDTGEFILWLKNIIETKKIDFLLPVTEVSSRTLLENYQHFNTVKLPFADLETVLQLSDKNRLVELADSLDVPVPTSIVCGNAEEALKQPITFPCVLKPSLSKVLVDQRWVSTQVHIVHTQTQMEQALQHSYFRFPFMVQQYIDGQGAGIFCYYQKGEPKAYFAHKRIREKPPSGGVSVLSESVEVHPIMKEHATRLLDSVKWHGVAMVEFKVDDQGTPYLMEINTRLWGSLQLAIDAGVNFPHLLLDGEYGVLAEQSHFKVGVQLRWLLGDLDNLYLNLKDRNQTLPAKIFHMFNFFTPKFVHRKHEINRLEDLGPFKYELKKYFSRS
ncbi:ATP-grasp domain-containing protein [Alteromonas ponticola]|uniref:ATP-grasp domain-containing protein n=1 Tax=Alteromonas aquimaris TaxID=2998417 RepID=A0ABT3P3C9_9ALTE|nr:ATP-grasp domain-containing protein [Alteromonas aquimaris]MCW8107270.1 ATP-grasp domain-containing protein [Alteromonas aquimaris]